MADFKDHFGGRAKGYAEFRPQYPKELFEWLAANCSRHEVAWDCGTGTGQAAVALAAHFAVVHATDAAARQIEAAEPHVRVRYAAADAGASGLPDSSIDLVVVAQALHWFDLEAFYREVRRVSRQGAILAVWSYGVPRIGEPEADELLQGFYWHTVGPYWPAERRHVENGYRDLPFPFLALAPPAVAMSFSWTCAHLVGYVRTWSAVRAYEQATGTDPVSDFEEALASRVTDATQPLSVQWPLSLRVGRVGVQA